MYEGILEEGALNLQGAKMTAAQIFYGDEFGGAPIEDEDDSDMLHGLLRQTLGQVEVGRAEGLVTPGNYQTVTDSAGDADGPMGVAKDHHSTDEAPKWR